MKNLKEKKGNQGEEKASPAQWKRIRDRAGELAMNRGKHAHEAGDKEMQRAKRELLDLEITSPKAAKAPKSRSPEDGADPPR